MANNGSIDEVIGQGVLKQVEDLSKSLKDLEDQFVRTAKAASTMSSVNVGASGGGGGVKQTTQGLTELEKATAKLNKTMSEYGQDIVKIRLLQQQQAATNKNDAKEVMSAAGSYKQLEAQMALMTARYKAMSAEMRSGAIGKALAADISNINTQLKSLDSGLGNMQRNVGNYTGALSKIWSVLRQAAYIIPGLGIAGIFNLLGEGIMFAADKLGIFKSALEDVIDPLSAMNKAVEGSDYKNAVISISSMREEIVLARKNIIDKTETLDKYNDTLGKTIGKATDLKEAESLIIKNGEAYIKMTTLKAAANLALEEAAKEALKAEQMRLSMLNQTDSEGNVKVGALKSLSMLFTEGLASDEDNMNKQVKKIENKGKELQTVGKNLLDEAAKVASAYNMDYYGGEIKHPTDKKGKTRIELLQQRYEQELLEAKRQSADLEETETQAYFRRLKIAEKYSKDKLLESKDLTTKEKEQATNFEDQLLSLVIDGTAKRKEENKKYLQMEVNDFALKVKLSEDEKKKQQEGVKTVQDTLKTQVKLYQDAGKERYDKLIEQQKKEKEAWENLKKDIIDSIAFISESIVNGIYAKRLQAIEDIDKKLTESFNNEMRFIEQSGLSQREKERKKQALEAETEAKRKKNDRDRVAELRKQAKLQKALDTAQIIANTAIAITSHMKLDPPLNLITIASDIAIGAAQLAKVVATPLPQYAKGRKGGKAEMAIVGEVGTEAIVTKDGKISFTPNKATKTFLPEGADVIPNHELIKNATLLKLSKEQNVTINKYQEALIEKFEEELTELKSIKQAILDKPVSTFNNFGGFDNYVKSNIR